MRTLESGHIVFHDIVPDYKTRYVASDIAGSVDILGRDKSLSQGTVEEVVKTWHKMDLALES